MSQIRLRTMGLRTGIGFQCFTLGEEFSWNLMLYPLLWKGFFAPLFLPVLP